MTGTAGEPLVTAAQMRALEAREMEAGRVTGWELMCRAGEGIVAALLAHWPGLAARPHRAVVLCGPGNNGGDGFVVARLLRGRGWQVRVLHWGTRDKMSPDAQAAFDRWRALGPVEPMDPQAIAAARADLFVDAIFGTGLSRAVPDLVHDALDAARRAADASAGRLVAVDMPSWFSSDSGAHLGRDNPARFDLVAAVRPMKRGQFTGALPAYVAAVAPVEIGLPAPEGALRLIGPPEGLSKPSGTAAHKYTQGHALVLSGGAGRTGAARLAARAALRAGAGLVTLGAPGAAQAECAAQLTAVMLREIGEGGALAAALEDRRLNALCLGPGLGVDDRGAGLVAAALASGRATVLDADALTLAADPERGLVERLHAGCLLTPHMGEFARLFPDLAERVAREAAEGYSRADAVRAAAARAGCTVLLKGADTFVADPSGGVALNAALYDRAAPWLATAGAGDVLAGLAAGLMARGLSPARAATAAAWLHVEAARRVGPGLIAEDLPEALPAVLAALEAREPRRAGPSGG